MRAKRVATLDDLAGRRAARRLEREPFVLDCDGESCSARGVFDTIRQMGGWSIDGRDRAHVVILCPRCNDRRKAKP
jgi:hypothetical protein